MLGLVLRRPACLAEDAAGRYISPFHDIPLRDGGAEVSGDGPLGPLGTGSVGVGLQGGAGRGAGVVPPLPSPVCLCWCSPRLWFPRLEPRRCVLRAWGVHHARGLTAVRSFLCPQPARRQARRRSCTPGPQEERLACHALLAPRQRLVASGSSRPLPEKPKQLSSGVCSQRFSRDNSRSSPL